MAFLAVEEVESLLPVSFGFAAGAMVALVVIELLPAFVAGGQWRKGTAGLLLGGLLMFALSVVLGVD